MHFLSTLFQPSVPQLRSWSHLCRTLGGWGRRQWLALCAQAERPGRKVPYY